ncbi:MAG: hypothetical protein LIP16_17825 [Clostridium sp.]|nr:hypothetical protein [Clostridium sp.]
MIARFILRFKCPVEQKIDDFCIRFPLLSSICIQFAAAVFMISIVGAIAVAGGSVIWGFYRLFGMV